MLQVLPSDSHVRGTFPHFARYGSLGVNGCANTQSLDVDTAPPGQPYSNDMPGEYELGRDAVDGGSAVYDNGNYGVVYHFAINVSRASECIGQPVGLLMTPAGGAEHYAEIVNDDIVAPPYIDYTSAWLFGQLGASQTRALLVTSLTGGSAGPQRFIFYPTFTGPG